MTPRPLPIRLRASHREALLAHFKALGPEDRRLRFGAAIGDAGLEAYVDRIDFTRDGAFAIQDDAWRLLAVVHVACGESEAELGLSVLPGHRGRGMGEALFERAVTYLRTRGARRVTVHCLAENAAMMHLARKHRMALVHGGSEADASLVLPPATADTYVGEWLLDQQSEMVQALRHQGEFTRALLRIGARR